MSKGAKFLTNKERQTDSKVKKKAESLLYNKTTMFDIMRQHFWKTFYSKPNRKTFTPVTNK